MKSKKVKAYQAHKKIKADVNLDESDSDVNPDSFFHDDIQDFNDEKDQLSTDDELIQHRDDDSSEEEVLPITDDEKDESEDEEQGLPNREAWGKKKSAYYSADFVDEDRGRTYREEDAQLARAEAEEALAIQKSLYSNINMDNLGSNIIMEWSDESSGEEIKFDSKAATKEEKLRYLKKETVTPNVVKECDLNIEELMKFRILAHLVKKKEIRSKTLEHYIKLKHSYCNFYCMCLNGYWLLANSKSSKKMDLKYHPLVRRMSELKKKNEELQPTDRNMVQLLDEFVEKFKKGERVDFCSDSEKEDDLKESVLESLPKDSNKISTEIKKIKKSKTKYPETENEKQVIALRNEVKEEMKRRKHENTRESEEDIIENRNEHEAENENTEDKRTITYQIAKNKGLVARRKKEHRNPRVHHKMKFRKANIRRKGQVRKVAKEVKRYSGEPTGININVVRGVKFK